MSNIISLINTPSVEELTEIVQNCTSLADILRKLGYQHHLNSTLYNALKARLNKDQIAYTHIPLGLNSNKGRRFTGTTNAYSKESFENKLKQTTKLCKNGKKLLRKFDLIPHDKCAICGQGRTWNNKELSLQLDHIDGNPTNNNLENLRFVCPNCHTQTETFCARNKQKTLCKDCGVPVTKKSKRCRKCVPKHTLKQTKTLSGIENKQQEKFTITKEELEKLVWEKPTSELAKHFGVSDTAIAKRCKRFGIKKPARGYWTRIKLQTNTDSRSNLKHLFAK